VINRHPGRYSICHPNGTVIPARAHFLATNSNGYSLTNYPAAMGPPATANITILSKFLTTSVSHCLVLPCPSTTPSRTAIDAVGSNADNNALYREGTGYPAIPSSALEGSFFRRLPGAVLDRSQAIAILSHCSRLLSAHQAAIRRIMTTMRTTFFMAMSGATDLGVSRRLSTPGPENLSAPVTGTISSGPGDLAFGYNCFGRCRAESHS
jgi:hypothetical protein